MVPVDECSSSNKCRSSSSPGCTNVLVVEDAPLIVNANSTALVGVKAYVEAQCTCHALTFDRCTAGSCLNGGTCQQLHHTIRSVNIITASPYNILLFSAPQHICRESAICYRLSHLLSVCMSQKRLKLALCSLPRTVAPALWLCGISFVQEFDGFPRTGASNKGTVRKTKYVRAKIPTNNV